MPMVNLRKLATEAASEALAAQAAAAEGHIALPSLKLEQLAPSEGASAAGTGRHSLSR